MYHREKLKCVSKRILLICWSVVDTINYILLTNIDPIDNENLQSFEYDFANNSAQNVLLEVGADNEANY